MACIPLISQIYCIMDTMKKVGGLNTIKAARTITIPVSILTPGVNDVGEFFVYLTREHEVKYIIDKVCDHRGGRLVLKNGQAICPLHHWRLNLDNLSYNDSHLCKTPLPYELNEQGDIEVVDYDRFLENPYLDGYKGELTLRWLNHATLYIECNGKTLITDPWLFGPAFLTGWWLQTPSPKDAIDLLKKVDYIYISHNHPDHLHPETLSIVSKDTPIITADFSTGSAEKYIKSLGFRNIMPLPFLDLFEIGPHFTISVLKSGDFRDDSGLYIEANGHQLLLAVDANHLNSYVLPTDIDFFAASFGGAASGFPLCFDNYSRDEKARIMKRNRFATRTSVNRYLDAVAPHYFMPYASMFAEHAPRDDFVREHNKKNSIDDLQGLLEERDSQMVVPKMDVAYTFREGCLEQKKLEVQYLPPDDIAFTLDKIKQDYPYNASTVIRYFQNVTFHKKQILSTRSTLVL